MCVLKKVNQAYQAAAASYAEVITAHDLKLLPICCVISMLGTQSNLLDVHLKPFATHVRIFLRNAIDFLNYLTESIPEKTVLAHLDVVSV